MGRVYGYMEETVHARLIGFDARELWLAPESQWTTEKRQDFLIKSDVAKPLSVDKYVWYTVFSENSISRIWRGIARKSAYNMGVWQEIFADERRLEKPDIYSPYGIWLSLPNLMTFLTSSWQQDWKPCAIVAIESISEQDNGQVGDGSLVVEPASLRSNWKLLGYDVADSDLFSGLADGKIDRTLSQRIKSEWVENLNQYHLFTDYEIALDYVAFANERNPSHSPFSVYGLHLIQMMRAGSLI